MREEPVIQIYLYHGRPILRSATKNARHPTEAQEEMRDVFKEIAHRAKGMKMTGNLPPAAEIVAEEMKGWGSDKKKKKKRVWEQEMEEYAMRRMEEEERAEMVLRRLGYGRV